MASIRKAGMKGALPEAQENIRPPAHAEQAVMVNESEGI